MQPHRRRCGRRIGARAREAAGGIAAARSRASGAALTCWVLLMASLSRESWCCRTPATTAAPPKSVQNSVWKVTGLLLVVLAEGAASARPRRACCRSARSASCSRAAACCSWPAAVRCAPGSSAWNRSS
jgi:hypothetical protein